MDTRLAFTLTNENLLVQPGQTIPSVPGWRFGTPNSLGVLFFDNYDTRYSGFETLSHVVAYRDFHKGHFDAETAFVHAHQRAVAEQHQPVGRRLVHRAVGLERSRSRRPDARSASRCSRCRPTASGSATAIGCRGAAIPSTPRANSATPGMKVQYDTNNGYAFVGAKSAVILDQRTAEDKSALAVLAGAGIDPTPLVRLEVNGGYFDRGYNELVDVDDQKVRLFGGSAQIAIHDGMPVQSSIDYKLYKYNNERIERPVRSGEVHGRHLVARDVASSRSSARRSRTRRRPARPRSRPAWRATSTSA